MTPAAAYLRSAALVSRVWVQPAQEALFRQLALDLDHNDLVEGLQFANSSMRRPYEYSLSHVMPAWPTMRIITAALDKRPNLGLDDSQVFGYPSIRRLDLDM
jgi:hypothetical protein